MLQAALKNQQLGRFSEAMAVYRRLLVMQPGMPDALHFLGLALHQSGQSAEGIKLMRQSIMSSPANAIFHNNFGFVLKAAGRLLESEAEHREAVRLQPGFVEAWYNLGVALQDQGKLEEAAEAYQRAIALRARLPKALTNLGGVLKDLGRLSESMEACRAALAIKPDLVEAAAILVATLLELERHDEAERQLDASLALAPADPRLLCLKAGILTDLSRLDEATATYDLVLERDRGQAAAYTGLATIAQNVGDQSRASEYFQQALAARPGYGPAVYGLAHSRKFSEADGELIREIRRGLERQPISRGDELSLHFALGKIYDDMGKHDQAFAHFQSANAIKRERTTFDRDAHRAYIDALIEVFDTGFFARRSADWGLESERPIFIVGMPRSGTTLVEQIISSHPRVAAGGEMRHLTAVIGSIPSDYSGPVGYPRTLQQLDRGAVLALGQGYLQRLPPGDPEQDRITDKMPANFFHVGLISILFPRARIIHCYRDPMDLCLSIYFQNFDSYHPYAYDLGDIGFYYREYERLMAHWYAALGPRLCRLNYAELVNKPDAETRRLVEYCGLEWDGRCLRFHDNKRPVNTASHWQVRQPIYQGSVQRWRDYESYLSPLKQAIGP